MEPEHFVSPCDGKVSVSKLDEKSVFQIKHTRYTAERLLRNRKLAKAYAGGYLWVFRLSVEDYHRYIYIDRGVESESVRIPRRISYGQSCGERCISCLQGKYQGIFLLRTENFGTVLQMEVGALLVGKIENHRQGRVFRRGQEKGAFAFGGSTILLMTQKGRVYPDQDLLEYSRRGIEVSGAAGRSRGESKSGIVFPNKLVHTI